MYPQRVPSAALRMSLECCSALKAVLATQSPPAHHFTSTLRGSEYDLYVGRLEVFAREQRMARHREQGVSECDAVLQRQMLQRMIEGDAPRRYPVPDVSFGDAWAGVEPSMRFCCCYLGGRWSGWHPELWRCSVWPQTVSGAMSFSRWEPLSTAPAATARTRSYGAFSAATQPWRIRRKYPALMSTEMCHRVKPMLRRFDTRQTPCPLPSRRRSKCSTRCLLGSPALIASPSLSLPDFPISALAQLG